MSLSGFSFLRLHGGMRRNSWSFCSRKLTSLNAAGKVHNLKISPHDIFKEGMKFDELNVSPALIDALAKQNLTTPTEMQAKSFDIVRNGNDTIIGGETGSGKTLAYMLPLIQKCIDSEGCKEPLQFSRAVILAPSKDLCRQIMKMTEGIFRELKQSGHDISIQFVANSTSYWPFPKKTSPYFCVTTPAIFSNYLKTKGSKEPHALVNHLKHIVLDEADMILDGSTSKDIALIYDKAKVARRELIREGQVPVHAKTLQTILSAATIPSKGTLSVRKFVEKQFPKAVEVRLFNMHKHHPCIEQEFIARDEESPLTESTLNSIVQAIKETLRKEVARTDTGVPFNENLDTSMLDNQLNFHNHSVMIFVNTAQVAEELAGALRKNYSIDCVEYHANLKQLVKAQYLAAFQSGAHRVLVCTDSAARGFDLPNVRHVIQAEFALNVVQHQHRVGRASRAGKIGYATNFYGPLRAELVESILGETQDLSNVETEEVQEESDAEKQEGVASAAARVEAKVKPEFSSIERSFSRRRGFRNNIKKAIRREREAQEEKAAAVATSSDVV